MFTIDEYIEAKRLGARHTGRAGSFKTLQSYRWALNKAEALLDTSLYQLTEGDAEDLLPLMEELSTATRAQIMAACRGIFDWAIATQRYEGRHPFSGISSPTVKRTLPTILSKEDVKTFFQSFTSEKYRLFFSLMYYGGLRIGEVQKLRRSDVLATHLVVQGKGDKQRIVYLPEKLLLSLQAYSTRNEESIHVFYGESRNGLKDQPMTLVTAYELFQEAKRACGLPDALHPHNLRHSFATHLQRQVRDITITQRALGHARPETTMLYAQIADEDVRAATAATFII